jgi:hypothetical protein
MEVHFFYLRTFFPDAAILILHPVSLQAASTPAGKKVGDFKYLKIIQMEKLTLNEMKTIDGGANYIGGLAPAIPSSGGEAAIGFFVGFVKGFLSAF